MALQAKHLGACERNQKRENRSEPCLPPLTPSLLPSITLPPRFSLPIIPSPSSPLACAFPCDCANFSSLSLRFFASASFLPTAVVWRRCTVEWRKQREVNEEDGSEVGKERRRIV